jgi:hypothetical protein
MPGRILNFSEFFDKYSKDAGSDDKNLDTFTQSSANFEEGFDKETYDQTQLGPNKPVAGSSDATPAIPGEAGAPAFSSTPDEEMAAPAEEEVETEEQESEEPEETEEDETPEPEAGANPEKEEDSKVEESHKFNKVKGFAQFIAESDWGPDYLQDDDYWSGDDHSNEGPDGTECETCGEKQWTSDFEDEYEEGTCPDCGTPFDEYGSTCGCNM